MAQSNYKSNDQLFQKILELEGGSVCKFLDSVFGFLYRNHADSIYGTRNISGEHLVSQSFCRWQQLYRNELSLRSNRNVGDAAPPAVEEVEVTSSVAEGLPASCGNASSSDVPAQNKSGRTDADHLLRSTRASSKQTDFDTTNGAVCEGYAWTQTIEDLEVRVDIPPTIQRGKQVKVMLKSTLVDVKILGTDGSWQALIHGNMCHNIQAEESMWSLLPGHYILLNLEKSKEKWWDKFLDDEATIDLKKINAERDYSTLPEEDRSKIQELIWNKGQQSQGKPASDVIKMESVLREAWDAEGSPFKGQPYDPSIINFATDSQFGK